MMLAPVAVVSFRAMDTISAIGTGNLSLGTIEKRKDTLPKSAFLASLCCPCYVWTDPIGTVLGTSLGYSVLRWNVNRSTVGTDGRNGPHSGYPDILSPQARDVRTDYDPCQESRASLDVERSVLCPDSIPSEFRNRHFRYPPNRTIPYPPAESRYGRMPISRRMFRP